MPEKIFTVNNVEIGTYHDSQLSVHDKEKDKCINFPLKKEKVGLGVLSEVELVEFFGVKPTDKSPKVIIEAFENLTDRVKKAGFDPDKGVFTFCLNCLHLFVIAHFPDILNKDYNYKAEEYIKAFCSTESKIEIFVEAKDCLISRVGVKLKDEIVKELFNSSEGKIYKDSVYIDSKNKHRISQIQEIMTMHKEKIL